MGIFDWFRKAVGASTPAALSAGGDPVASAQPLYLQFQRIGGGLTPAGVTSILREADSGQPARLIDLTNESRQKDGHLQGALGTRDQAVSLLDLSFIEPEDATPKEQEASKLCRRIVADFRNWPELVEHLTSSYLAGHATSEIKWELVEGHLLPCEAAPIHARRFIFSRDAGELRFSSGQGDLVGTDILADNPGRIVQIQRRIVGDVPAREGLARVLVWGALLRNWGMRDWIALGEVGWKPWRIGRYKKGAHQKDVDKLLRALERIGSSGVGVFSDDADISVEWPKNPTGKGASSHGELQAFLGREMSKAILGQTTSMESGENGDRASTQTRDQIRKDIRESEARAVAATLRYHLFMPAVAVNLGGDVRCPVPAFQTQDEVNRKDFSEAVKNMREAGVRIPAKWVRDEVGMPEPLDDEEVLALPAAEPTPPGEPGEPVAPPPEPDE